MDPDLAAELLKAMREIKDGMRDSAISPAAIWATVAGVVGTLVTSFAWLLRYTFGTAIPKINEQHQATIERVTAQHRATLDQQREDFLAAIEQRNKENADSRREFAEQMEAQRVNCREEHRLHRETADKFLDYVDRVAGPDVLRRRSMPNAGGTT